MRHPLYVVNTVKEEIIMKITRGNYGGMQKMMNQILGRKRCSPDLYGSHLTKRIIKLKNGGNIDMKQITQGGDIIEK